MSDVNAMATGIRIDRAAMSKTLQTGAHAHGNRRRKTAAYRLAATISPMATALCPQPTAEEHAKARILLWTPKVGLHRVEYITKSCGKLTKPQIKEHVWTGINDANSKCKRHGLQVGILAQYS